MPESAKIFSRENPNSVPLQSGHREFQQFGIGVYQCCTCLRWLYSRDAVSEHMGAVERRRIAMIEGHCGCKCYGPMLDGGFEVIECEKHVKRSLERLHPWWALESGRLRRMEANEFQRAEKPKDRLLTATAARLLYEPESGCPGCERCSDESAETIRAMQVSPEFVAAVARDVEERKNLLASLKEHGRVACQPVGEEL